MKQGRRAQKFILLHWWTYVIWKMLKWRQKHQQYKSRVVLRGDIVKDDSGSYAVFTKQGSSASQMKAAKVMDIISRLPGCDGQAADAVSAYIPGKMEEAQNYWKFQNRNVQTFGFVYHDTNGLNPGPVSKTQLFLLNGICTVILWPDCYRKGNLRKSFCSTVGKMFPNWNVSSYTVKRVILICVCGWHQIGWKETKHCSDVESNLDLG